MAYQRKALSLLHHLYLRKVLSTLHHWYLPFSMRLRKLILSVHLPIRAMDTTLVTTKRTRKNASQVGLEITVRPEILPSVKLIVNVLRECEPLVVEMVELVGSKAVVVLMDMKAAFVRRRSWNV